MNDPRARKRVIWLAVGGGVLLCLLLFVSLLAPSGQPELSTPSIRPSTAQTASEASPDTVPAGFSIGRAEALSLAWRLGLVAVIIGASIVCLRWWAKRTAGPTSVTGFLRVVDTLAISNGRSIHLVALGRRVIAVGATAQQLSFLNELSADEASEVLGRLDQSGQPALAGFAAELFDSMRHPLRTSIRGRGPHRSRNPEPEARS